MIADAAELQMNAERKLGAMLAAAKAAGLLSKGGRPRSKIAPVSGGVMRATLKAAGITFNLSAKAQKLAAVPDRRFAALVKETRAISLLRREAFRQFERSDLSSGSGKIAISDGDLPLSFAGQFDQRLLKKLDIRLWACGTTLHLLLGRENFHPANVLRGYLPRPVPEADLAIMRRLDRLHLEPPFAGSRMLRGLLAPEGCKTGRRHVTTLMKRMGIEARSIAVRARRSPSPAIRSIRICCAGWRSRGRTRCGRWTSRTSRWRVASSIPNLDFQNFRHLQ